MDTNKPKDAAEALDVRDDSAISVDDIQNGTIWEAKWPQCWTVIIQWLSGDRYLLLSAPEPARHGGTCQVTHIRNDGKEIRTRQETLEVLEKWGARRTTAVLSLRNRAFYDRKGKPAALNVSFYYSTRRRDQFDVFMDGKLILTGAPRKIAQDFHILLANFAGKSTVEE